MMDGWKMMASTSEARAGVLATMVGEAARRECLSARLDKRNQVGETGADGCTTHTGSCGAGGRD